MAKILILGDIHGHSSWKKIVDEHIETVDKIIFLGDYLDSFNISGGDQLKNLEEIIEYKSWHPKKIILLLGNHDIHYFKHIEHSPTKGYQPKMKMSFQLLLEENKKLFQMCFSYRNFLFSHAGISYEFLKRSKYGMIEKITEIVKHINNKWISDPMLFEFIAFYNGYVTRNFYGNSTWQSPVWIRERSLMSCNEETFMSKFTQVFGHTHNSSVHLLGKYHNLDIMPKYGIIENNKLIILE